MWRRNITQRATHETIIILIETIRRKIKNMYLKNIIILGLLLMGVGFACQHKEQEKVNFKMEGNPLVRHIGAADPDVHMWDNVVWMYCSQDHQRQEGDRGNYDHMDGYHAFSSSDMIHWTDHGEVPHVTRTPIAAISKLYTNTTPFADKTLTPGNNILSDIKSKAFDMTAEFDLNKTTAKTITFTIANKSYTYKIAEQKLVGRSMRKTMKDGERIVISSDTDLDLKPDADGKLKIRMLIDWSNIEIFANKGVFSYSEHFALDPKANNVEINVDGDVKLTSLEFNQIKSIW